MAFGLSIMPKSMLTILRIVVVIIGIKYLYSLKKNNFELDSGEKGIVKWIDEIVWREFYKNIMFSFPKVSRGSPFQDYTKNIKWRFNENEFQAWKDGRTGFPIIDSAMKQLKSEGWMHNLSLIHI